MSNKRKIFSYFKNKTIRKIENLNSKIQILIFL